MHTGMQIFFRLTCGDDRENITMTNQAIFHVFSLKPRWSDFHQIWRRCMQHNQSCPFCTLGQGVWIDSTAGSQNLPFPI